MTSSPTRFDLEQQLLDCWGIVDELNLLYGSVLERDDMTTDRISNILLGMKELYQLKFEQTFNTFETLAKTDKL